MAWMKDRGLNDQPTYEEIIGELRPSFQQKMSKEIAEHKLVGREWNIFTSIDAFLHETRKLVQCALPGFTRQWPDRIRSCLMQALPLIWDQILSSTNKNNMEIVEWLRAQTAKIQNTPQEEWDEWVKAAYRQNQKASGMSTQIQKGTPYSNGQMPKCTFCGGNHKSFVCGTRQQRDQQQQQGYGNRRPTSHNYINSQSGWHIPLTT
ncbi:MAG: hypothetical protein GY820_44420, partial [Gammaproteobacteria bacterium]|nr:hypothetical protein [Gammaproteobacteria bacterium]